MRKDQHAVAGFERITLQEDRSVAFAALEPQQFARATWTYDIEPHQPRIVEREETREATIARKDIEHGNYRMPAAEQVTAPSRGDRGDHGLRRPLDALLLGHVNFPQNVCNLFVITFR